MAQLKDDRLLIYGGQSFDLEGNPVILSDVHVYNPSQRSWEKPINCRGEARQWHSATFLPERQLLLAFGGETQDATSKNNKNKVTTTDSLKVSPEKKGKSQ
jgi:N-acetylneuraminic acid mutarotase